MKERNTTTNEDLLKLESIGKIGKANKMFLLTNEHIQKIR